MKKFPVVLPDLQICELFKILANPNPNKEFVEEMIEFCMNYLGHDSVEQEVQDLMNHPAYNYMRNLYSIRFNEDISLHLKDHIQMCKEMERLD